MSLSGKQLGTEEGVFKETIVVAATFKVLVLGNSNVGKSSLIHCYSEREKLQSMMPTIGIDFTDIIIAVRGTDVKLRVWDTAGQERFFTFTKQFFRGTQGILLVYDVTSMESFQTLLKWNQTIEEYGLCDVSMVIVANKCDLNLKRVVPKEVGEQLANKRSVPYLETSAATGYNVKKAFYKLAETLIHSHGIFQPGQEAEFAEETSTSVSVGQVKKCMSVPEGDDHEPCYENRRTKNRNNCCIQA